MFNVDFQVEIWWLSIESNYSKPSLLLSWTSLDVLTVAKVPLENAVALSGKPNRLDCFNYGSCSCSPLGSPFYCSHEIWQSFRHCSPEQASLIWGNHGNECAGHSLKRIQRCEDVRFYTKHRKLLAVCNVAVCCSANYANKFWSSKQRTVLHEYHCISTIIWSRSSLHLKSGAVAWEEPRSFKAEGIDCVLTVRWEILARSPITSFLSGLQMYKRFGDKQREGAHVPPHAGAGHT